MDRYICIHGHFYQPPRENPWLEDVELQDSAHPYHDWNEKITEECYRQNAASRILDPDRKIIDIADNYTKISFDFGPTLLSWMEKHAPDVYESVIDADIESRERFSGHGAAMALSYNHMIMPLANRRDKDTQVVWGIYDFEHRFGRRPEGMWLPETAVDMETLEVLAEHDIKFTVLAPHQAKRFRKIGDSDWINLERDAVDTTVAYSCKLRTGKEIALFFYDHKTALDVAEGRILHNGEVLARRMAAIAPEHKDRPTLGHIATDGETYGHHHRSTDMALAYCLHFIETHNLARITIYSEYLEKFPPQHEVEIYENSSWSCSHGVERWRANCGCSFGRFPSGKQEWRSHLRRAMDWLRDHLAEIYEKNMARYVSDAWATRNEYISVIMDRSRDNISAFLAKQLGADPSYSEMTHVLKLLEMQRNAMLMYTSCGWFFDDICGIETVQIMNYASRAIQLAKEIEGVDLEPGYEDILEDAPTNVKTFANGKEAYNALVKPSSIDLNRVGAHLAVSSLFEHYPEQIDIHCYSADVQSYDRTEAGIQVLAVGRAAIRSNIVLERHLVDFAVLHFGEQNLMGAVSPRMADKEFTATKNDLKAAFNKGDTTEVIRLLNLRFNGNNYSLWHLFKDEQRRILYELLDSTWQEIESSFRHIYEHNYTVMQIMKGMNIPLPRALATPAEFIINSDLCSAIQDESLSIEELRRFAEQARMLPLALDEDTLRFEASRRINKMILDMADSPMDMKLLARIRKTLEILLTLVDRLDVQTAQNALFALSRQDYPEVVKKASTGDDESKKWVDSFKALAQYLNVNIE